MRKAGLRMGLYHSLREWYNPAYIAVRPSPPPEFYMVESFYCSAVVVAQDQADNCSTTTFVDDILLPTMKQMVEQYQVLYSMLSEQLSSHSYPTMGGSKLVWDISINTRYCCCTAGGDMGRWCRRQSMYTQLHQVLEGSSVPQLALQ